MTVAELMTARLMSSSDGAQPTADPRVADLVRAGRLRIGLFPPQYVKDATSGAITGVWADVARALATRLGVEFAVLEKPTPAEVIDALNAGDCDIASLGFDPSRIARVGGFSPPFMRVDLTYLVPAGSPIRCVADADRPGARIATVREHASTLALDRMRRLSEHVSVETADAAFELMRGGHVDAWASIRPMLLDYARQLPGSRVLDDNFGANFPALVVAKGHDARLAYISEFVEEAKASGLVQQAIERAGQPGYHVAVAREQA